MEFVWKIYAGKTAIEILECIKHMMEEKGTQPSQVQDRIIFMSMYNDIEYWKKNNRNECCDSAKRVAQFAQNFKPGQWSFLDPGDEETWYGSLIDKPHGEWNSIAENMMQ